MGSKKHLGASDLPRCAHLDLLDESRYQALLANPALLWLELRALPAQRVAVLDEFQRVHAVLNEVQRAIEGARRRFVLLGIERARRLKTADTNLLAGRAAVQIMYPLVPAELGANWLVCAPSAKCRG